MYPFYHREITKLNIQTRNLIFKEIQRQNNNIPTERGLRS
jgi:hypothetical protein